MRPRLGNFAAASLLTFALLFVWITIRREQWHSYQQSIQDSVKAHSATLKQQAEEQVSKEHDQTDTLRTQSKLTSSLNDGYAYGFYATNDQYACSVLVNIRRLQKLQTKIPIHVIASTAVSQRYTSALENGGATVHIEQPPPLPAGAGGYYVDCLLKLLAFKLHRLSPGLKRVLAFDSDQLIMQNLDHLFEGLPLVDVAAPRAYWIAKDFLASTFLMISLSDRLWETVKEALRSVGFGKFDMDLINDLLGDQVMMLSGEYVTLNSHWEDWNLPRWYHPTLDLNMTTIEKVNALARPQAPSLSSSNVILPGYDRRRAGTGDVQETSGPSNSSSQLNLTASQSQQTAPPLASTPPLTGGLSPQMPTGPPKPRFPSEHPLAKELERLQDDAAVIHFSAVGKPWMVTEDAIQMFKPDAHPLLGAQFQTWRNIASEVCPGFEAGELNQFFP